MVLMCRLGCCLCVSVHVLNPACVCSFAENFDGYPCHCHEDATSGAESCCPSMPCFHCDTTAHSCHGLCHQQHPKCSEFWGTECARQPSGTQQADQSECRGRATSFEECCCSKSRPVPQCLLTVCLSCMRYLLDHLNGNQRGTKLCFAVLCAWTYSMRRQDS